MMAGLLALRIGTRMKICWKRWKWGRMPRNASQKWVYIERCKMECGVRWCNWIPQNWRRAWKNSETGTARPCSMKSRNMTVSKVPSYGWSSPWAARHWITAWLGSSPIFSNSRTAASDILLFHQPVERSATSSTSSLDLFFLGAISVPRAVILARGLWEGLVEGEQRRWKLEFGFKISGGVKTLKVTARFNKVSNGNSVNIWKHKRSLTILSGF